MKNRAFFFAVFLALTAGAAYAENSSSNYSVNGTTRIRAYINMTAYGPAVNSSFEEGEEFVLSFNVTCVEDSCRLVEIYPLFCSGVGCTQFRFLEPNPSAGIYLQGSLPHKCLTLQPETIYVEYCEERDDCPCPVPKPAEVCSNAWRVHVKNVGFYSTALMVIAENADTVYSDIYFFSVRGCGDGNCSANETYGNCPEDCCEEDCTGLSDERCHKECDEINGCNLAYGCDGKNAGWQSCASNTTYLSCCSAGLMNCSSVEYCAGSGCVRCSLVCDGLCESSLCSGVDPDCDQQGMAAYPCCGNDRADRGEQCDGNATGTLCDGGCEFDCTCPTTTTRIATTSSTMKASTTTTTTTASSSSTTSFVPFQATTTRAEKKPVLDIALVVFVFLAIAVMASLAVYLRSSNEKRKLRKEYWELKSREDVLPKLIKTVKEEYAGRHMDSQAATKMIYKYEKELSENRKRTTALTRKLGIKRKRLT